MKKSVFSVTFLAAVLFAGSLFAQADKGGNGRSAKGKQQQTSHANAADTTQMAKKHDGGGGVKNGKTAMKKTPKHG